MFKEILLSSLIGAGTAAGVGCGDNGRDEGIVKDISTGAKSLDKVEELKGDNFEIIRIGDNVFRISGDDREAGMRYLSKECDVNSVGAWQLNDDGSFGSRVEQVAVVVENEDCLPELR